MARHIVVGDDAGFAVDADAGANAFVVEGGRVLCADGIPRSPRWFADGRLAARLDGTGVTRVEYYAPKPGDGNAIVFLKGLHDGLCWYVEREGRLYAAAYRDSVVWPFGIESRWDVQGVAFHTRVFLISDAIYIVLEAPDGDIPDGLRFQLEFRETFAFVPTEQNNFLYTPRGAVRNWGEWRAVCIREGAGGDGKAARSGDTGIIQLEGGFVETPTPKAADPNDIRVKFERKGDGADDTGYAGAGAEEAQAPELVVCVRIVADFPAQYEKRGVKHILRGADPIVAGRAYAFFVVFNSEVDGGENGTEGAQICAQKLLRPQEAFAAQKARYERVAEAAPSLESPWPTLDAFFQLAPMYHESLKVLEIPGAFRAKTTNYWVWGWDSLTSNAATLFWGDAESIRDMLRLFERAAHPRLGIAHAYRTDMGVASVCDLPAQGMYITLLDQYWRMAGGAKEAEAEAEVRARYPFAKKTFDRIRASEVAGTGLCEGISLFPDFPVYLSETGHDLSAFNNTVFYCAVRAMERLAAFCGDGGTAREAARIRKAIEERFLPLFYDAEKGFVVNSVDSRTLERRACYSANAVKWESDDLTDLVDPVGEASLAFFEQHLLAPAGIRPLPVWDKGYDGDANQLHSWWPVMGEYYMRLVNRFGRADLMGRWLGWVDAWVRRLTIPEGIPCYTEASAPEMDEWDTACGTWQAYSMRGWYQAAIHGVVGVSACAKGLRFSPWGGPELTLRGLWYRGSRVDIAVRGSGRRVAYLELGAERLPGATLLPAEVFDCLKPRIITAMRAP